MKAETLAHKIKKVGEAKLQSLNRTITASPPDHSEKFYILEVINHEQ